MKRREELNFFIEGQIKLPKDETDVSRFEQEVTETKEMDVQIIRTVCLSGRRYENFDTMEAFKNFRSASEKSLKLAGTLLASIIISQTLSAQRYVTEVFTNTTVTSNTTYGDNYSVLTGSPILENLVMDIYEPSGDTLSERYLIVLNHDGGYLPKYINQLPFGDKGDSSIVEIANRFVTHQELLREISYTKTQEDTSLEFTFVEMTPEQQDFEITNLTQTNLFSEIQSHTTTGGSSEEVLISGTLSHKVFLYENTLPSLNTE